MIIQKYDEVALMVRRYDWNGTAQIRVNELQKTGGGRRL
jgi:hypothetical protein